MTSGYGERSSRVADSSELAFLFGTAARVQQKKNDSVPAVAKILF